MAEEIVKTKKYAKPEVLHCGGCPHCLHFFIYGDCEIFYCLVDDKYKFNDYPEEKDCPFKEDKLERARTLIAEAYKMPKKIMFGDDK